MNSYIYRFYTLPLRVFLARYDFGNTETDKFIKHHLAVFSFHGIPLIVNVFINLFSKSYSKENEMILVILTGSLFYSYMYFVIKSIDKAIATKQLSTDEKQSPRLFAIGGFLFFEPYVFVLVMTIWFLFFHLPKY